MKNKKKKKGFLAQKVFMASFIVISLVQVLGVIFFLSTPNFINAQEENSIDLQVPIGDTNNISFDASTAPIAKYIGAIYKYSIGVVGILAAVMLMVGGVIWLVAGGNATRVSEAKAWIASSLTGLVLVMTSYLLLSQINSDLINFKITKLQTVGGEEENIGSNANCHWISAVKCGKNEEISEGSCDPTKNQTGEEMLCCCAVRPKKCPADTSIRCEICKNCTTFNDKSFNRQGNYISYNDGREANKDLVGKVRNAYIKGKNAGYIITVSEAWPPVVNHKEEGHANGKAVDISFENLDNHKNTLIVKKLFDNLSGQGLSKVLYECTTGPECCNKYNSAGISNCMYNAYASGNHFHIEL
jgi:hypothetical protein